MPTYYAAFRVTLSNLNLTPTLIYVPKVDPTLTWRREMLTLTVVFLRVFVLELAAHAGQTDGRTDV